MKNILVDMFKDFNQKSEVIYFVDPVAKEIKYSNPGGECGKVCSLDQVKSAVQEKEFIKLKGDRVLVLTVNGPEF